MTRMGRRERTWKRDQYAVVPIISRRQRKEGGRVIVYVRWFLKEHLNS